MIKRIKKNRLKLEFNKIKDDIKYLSYDCGIVGRYAHRVVFVLERTIDGEEKISIKCTTLFELLGSDYDEDCIGIFDDSVIDIISHLIKNGKENLIINHCNVQGN